MRILLHTRFHPNVGGIETVASLLAHEWQRSGHHVAVVSDVACSLEERREFPFPVRYGPGVSLWLRLMRETDVFVHMNVSLKALWPQFFTWRCFVAVHHGCYFVSRSKERDWKEKLKLRCAHNAKGNIAASTYIAREIGIACDVVPNPFDDMLFRNANPRGRERELAFVGRLVSDKGCDLLIQALDKLRDHGLKPHLTVIGDGPERTALEQVTTSLRLDKQIAFVGVQTQDKIARLLQQHEILVVPSLWEEPFGIVALEGAACGCVVLGSDGGGLPEAIGPAGTTFRRGDVSDLAAILIRLLRHPEEWRAYRAAAPAHLELHRPARVARRYLEVFERALKRSGKWNPERRKL